MPSHGSNGHFRKMRIERGEGRGERDQGVRGEECEVKGGRERGEGVKGFYLPPLQVPCEELQAHLIEVNFAFALLL